MAESVSKVLIPKMDGFAQWLTSDERSRFAMLLSGTSKKSASELGVSLKWPGVAVVLDQRHVAGIDKPRGAAQYVGKPMPKSVRFSRYLTGVLRRLTRRITPVAADLETQRLIAVEGDRFGQFASKIYAFAATLEYDEQTEFASYLAGDMGCVSHRAR